MYFLSEISSKKSIRQLDFDRIRSSNYAADHRECRHAASACSQRALHFLCPISLFHSIARQPHRSHLSSSPSLPPGQGELTASLAAFRAKLTTCIFFSISVNFTRAHARKTRILTRPSVWPRTLKHRTSKRLITRFVKSQPNRIPAHPFSPARQEVPSRLKQGQDGQGEVCRDSERLRREYSTRFD